MSLKTFIYGGVFVGSIIGGYIPVLWGTGLLSFSSVLWSAIGGFVGLVIAYKIGKNLFL